MEIEIKKTTNYRCDYTITRNDQSVESISLDTKTYLLHDVCHYVVEKRLNYKKGFWGMLAQGYSFAALLGKDNPDTEELRFIEQIVGPVQSAFSGNISKENFALFISHIDFEPDEYLLDVCLDEITMIMSVWEELSTDELLILEWK